MRLRIDLAYDGTGFRGWATQPGLRTVQAEVEAALKMALRVPRVTVVCAGRTDAGVHARDQVIHTDLAAAVTPRELERLARRLSGILPADVHVRRAIQAPPGFDARYSALWRRYTYRVADRPELVDPLNRHHVLVWSHELDLEAMNAASAALLGRHDFSSFCRKRPGATTIRTLLDLAWTRDEWGVASASVRADAFCHSMVRALVGCLIAIGEGRRPVSWAQEILGAEFRDPSVIVAHARGLTLEQVAYPPDEDLLVRAQQTRARRASLD